MEKFSVTAILTALILATAVLGAIEICAAADSPVFGYPHDSYSTTSRGGDYSYYGSSFALNGDATVTSVSCKLMVEYSMQNPDLVSHIRYAIYRDNGQTAQLIAQTEIASQTAQAINVRQNDKWVTLNLPSPIHLGAGSYWLIVVDDSTIIELHTEQVSQRFGWVSSDLGSMNFPSELETGTFKTDSVFCIYASGEGTVSVVGAPGPEPSNPSAAYVTLNAQNSGDLTGTVHLVGNLAVYGGGISGAKITLEAREETNFTYQQFAEVTTGQDGGFTADWTPPALGNYVINATYWGSQTYYADFTEINVLVTQLQNQENLNVFSVQSNSTVANLAFNQQSGTLSFNVEGDTGTYGYADVCIGKNLISDPNRIAAYIDQTQTTFTFTDAGESWVLHFSYHHSTHEVRFDLRGNSNQAVEGASLWVWIVLAAALVAVAGFLAAVFLRRKKQLPS